MSQPLTISQSVSPQLNSTLLRFFSLASPTAKMSATSKIEPSKHFYISLRLTSETILPRFSVGGETLDGLKKRKIGGRHYNALLYESRVRLRERFSFETREIKSFSLPVPSRDSAEMIRFMCHSIICSLKAFSLSMQLYRMDVNDNVGRCDVGLATGGASDLVSLIDHTCLGNVSVFIH